MLTFYLDAVFGLETSEYTVGDSELNLTIAVQLFENELAVPIELQLTSLDVSASKLLQ